MIQKHIKSLCKFYSTCFLYTYFFYTLQFIAFVLCAKNAPHSHPVNIPGRMKGLFILAYNITIYRQKNFIYKKCYLSFNFCGAVAKNFLHTGAPIHLPYNIFIMPTSRFYPLLHQLSIFFVHSHKKLRLQSTQELIVSFALSVFPVKSRSHRSRNRYRENHCRSTTQPLRKLHSQKIRAQQLMKLDSIRAKYQHSSQCSTRKSKNQGITHSPNHILPQIHAAMKQHSWGRVLRRNSNFPKSRQNRN